MVWSSLQVDIFFKNECFYYSKACTEQPNYREAQAARITTIQNENTLHCITYMNAYHVVNFLNPKSP
jgi:hypothetical protein